MKIKGFAHKYGDDIDTDVIIPARYLNTTDPKELASHCMEPADANFAKKVKPGDIMVVGKNFGSGSSREHAAIAIKEAGIGVVIAKNYARIFYRNAFNTGLPLLECPEAATAIKAGDKLEVELERGVIVNKTSGKTYQALPIPEFMLKIVQEGGLIPTIKKQIAKR
jgi:3-isopropylmalate/(R)-2-methylmalate dehydratase small subunit